MEPVESASTVTSAAAEPIWRVKETVVGWPSATWTPLRVKVAKPGADASHGVGADGQVGDGEVPGGVGGGGTSAAGGVVAEDDDGVGYEAALIVDDSAVKSRGRGGRAGLRVFGGNGLERVGLGVDEVRSGG